MKATSPKLSVRLVVLISIASAGIVLTGCDAKPGSGTGTRRSGGATSGSSGRTTRATAPSISGGYSSAEAAARAFLQAPIDNSISTFRGSLLPKEAIPPGKRSAYSSNYDSMLSGFSRVASRCSQEGTKLTEVLSTQSLSVPRDLAQYGTKGIRVVQLKLWAQRKGVREAVSVVTVQHSGSWFALPVGTSSGIIR